LQLSFKGFFYAQKMISTIEITTPALLFSTVSLVMLAYTNRFLALAKLIRDLHDKYMQKPEKIVMVQIHLLHKRVELVKKMQFLCVSSLLISVVSMLSLVWENTIIAGILFIIALLLLSISLAYSVWEITISTKALNISLIDMRQDLSRSTVSRQTNIKPNKYMNMILNKSFFSKN
jgi:hypothetical protein